ATDRPRDVVGRIARSNSCRTEHRHRGAEPGQGVEALDELRQDPQRTPRIRVEECRALVPLEEPLVLGRLARGREEMSLVGPEHDTSAAATFALGHYLLSAAVSHRAG